MSIVNNLPAYVNDNRDELLAKSMMGAKTLDYIEVMANVKGKTALNYLDSTVVFADGAECGFNAEGADTLTQRTIEVKPIKVNKEFCQRDLLNTSLNYGLMVAAGRETLPFEQKFIDTNLAAINAKLETLIWQGDASLGIDGFLAQLEEEAGVVDVTAADINALIDAVYDAIPENVMDKDVHIFVSPANYRAYVKALNAECCGNRDVIDAAAAEIFYPGDTRVRIVGVPGLAGQNVAVAGARDNFVYGTDLEDSQSVYDFWYSTDDRIFKMEVLFNAGTQIKFPTDAVYGKIA